MPQPYDYSLNLPDPTQTFLQSFQLGQQLKKRAAEQALQERRQTVYAGLSPTSTYQDYMSAIKQLPEDRENLLATMKAMGEAKQNALFEAGGKAFSVLQPGPDGKLDVAQAVSKLEEYATAFDNSGDAETAKQLRDSAKALEIDPAHGRNVLGTMLAMTDPTRFKAITDARENKIASDISDLAAVFGEEAARKLVLGREAAKGVVSSSGPAGTVFQRADEVFNLPVEQQPAAAAGVAAGGSSISPVGIAGTSEDEARSRAFEARFPNAPKFANDSQNSMSVDQFNAAAGALGAAGAAGLVKRNNIPVRVRTPQEARKLPSGTQIIMPDGGRGVVP